MIISWGRKDDGSQIIVAAMTAADLLHVLAGFGEIDLRQIPEAQEHHGLRIILTGPVGAEVILRDAVERRDSGEDVRFRGRPGIPDE